MKIANDVTDVYKRQGVDPIQQKSIAGVALAVGPDRLIAQATVGPRAAGEFCIYSGRKNGESGEAACGQRYGVDLCFVQDVTVRRIDGIDQRLGLDFDHRSHLAHRKGRVDRRGAVGLHRDRWNLCLLYTSSDRH